MTRRPVDWGDRTGRVDVGYWLFVAAWVGLLALCWLAGRWR